MRLPFPMLGRAALLAAALCAGWFGRDAVRGDAPAPRPAPPAQARADTSPTQHAPLIAISDDGRATVRVEQQPLDWVLDEIARQSGRRALREPVAAAASQAAAGPGADAAAQACPEPLEPPQRADQQRVLHAIERGSESERFDGLLQARGDAIVLSSTLLKSLYETDASERVRLLAFEAWLEQNTDQPALTRGALDAALLLPGTAVPAEARRRLEELQQMERSDPDDAQLVAGP